MQFEMIVPRRCLLQLTSWVKHGTKADTIPLRLMCIAVNSWASDTLTIHTQLSNRKLPFIARKQCQNIVRILNVRLFCKLVEFLEPSSSFITPLLQVLFPSLLLPHRTWYTSSKYNLHYNRYTLRHSAYVCWVWHTTILFASHLLMRESVGVLSSEWPSAWM